MWVIANLIACSQTIKDPSIDSPSEVEDTSLEIENCEVQAVFANNGCLDCHGSNAELNGGGINLTEAHIESSLIGASSNSPGCENEFLVNVDHPEASILLHTLSPEEYADAVGPDCSPMPMPLGGMNTVPMEDVECLEEWINTLEPNTETPDLLFEAPALTVLTRVKYLLDGGALTAEELESASGENSELHQDGFESLVASWMASDRFLIKRRQFLELHLQQTPSDDNYYNQFRNTQPNSMGPMREAFSQSIVRTAERIIDNDEDFRTIATTNTWEVTTLTLLALKMADNPMFLKPNGVWPKNNALNDIKYVTMPETGLYDRELDSQDWRSVTLIHNPNTTDMSTEEDFLEPENAELLRSIPDGGSIELRTPRLGFFTSPAFFQTWQTNRDNDFRVTINQAMIVATGQTFSPGDTTPLNGDEEAIDPELFPSDSTCYGCHKNIDPMRPAFLAFYDNINTRYTTPEFELPSPGFSFRGQSVDIGDLHDWADALAHHPDFAMAWVLKLCQWASSVECSATDEHIIELAEDFANHHNMNLLFEAFFTSPLMTMTSNNLDSVVPGAQVSVARFGHYCQAMRSRLSDVREAQGTTGELPDRLDICREDGPAEVLSASLPKDQVVRGSIPLHQPKDYTPMVSIAFEGMCAVSAEDVVSTERKAAFDPETPEMALELMNTHLLGFPIGTAQHDNAADMLQRYFNAQTASPACETTTAFQAALVESEPACGLELSDEDALRNLWTMVCQSPSMTGVGQ